MLILGSSVSGGTASMEARAAASLGLGTEVVTPAQWEDMTPQEFMTYRALIIGDAACTNDEAAFQAALDSRSRWGPIIDGNIFIIGSNPSSNSTTTPPDIDPIVLGGVELATERPLLTGMYLSLGCAYQHAPLDTPVPLLSPFGEFTVAGHGATRGHVPAQLPPTFSQRVSDGLLTGTDGEATRLVFTHYPSHDFLVGALAVDETGSMPGSQPFCDDEGRETFTGAPFILMRGAMATGLACSGDSGPRPPLAGQPPVAACRDVTVVLTNV
ncbi:MAG TPA: surface protein, partial [Myxococcaceae bacterium]